MRLMDSCWRSRASSSRSGSWRCSARASGRSWSPSASSTSRSSPAAARLDPRAAGQRLRARGALGRRSAAIDPRRPHPPELDLPGDRPGHARDGRRRSSTWPASASSASARRIPRRPEWGTMLTDTVRYLQTAPFLAIIPGLRDRHLGARLQPDRRRASRGARPEAEVALMREPLLDRRRPPGRVLDQPRHRVRGQRGLVRHRAGRDARHRRRVGLRQERDLARAARDPRRATAGSPAGARCSRAATCSSSPTRRLRAIRGREIAMIFQDPMTSLNPVLTIGRQIREALETHFDMRGRTAERRARRAARPGRHPECERRLQRLPAPVLGRDAPAGDDRDGARVRAEAADRRRADDRARRDDPGPDPRPAARARRASGTRR